MGKMKDLAIKLMEQQELTANEAAYMAGIPHEHYEEDAEIRTAIEADDIDPEYNDYLDNHGQGHCPHCDGPMSAYEQESFGYCGQCYETAQQSIQNWDRLEPE